MELGLTNKHVLVTGASQGIGYGLALAFAREGAQVSVVARREAELAALVEEMGGREAGHNFHATDLMAAGAPVAVVDALSKRNGPIQIVVHALGGTLGVRNPLSPAEDWARVWHLNVGIAIEINMTVVPFMIEAGWGRLVHISSTASVDHQGSGPYAAAKSYLNGYVRSLGRALAPRGVIVSGVMPGGVIGKDNHWVDKQANAPEAIDNFLSNHQAIGRLGEIEELSPFVLLLASDLGSFSAGALIPIDGGVK